MFDKPTQEKEIFCTNALKNYVKCAIIFMFANKIFLYGGFFMFNSSALFNYFESNKELPHVSIYHREGYMEHCLLVIYEMSKWTDDPMLMVAAALHDIAKPRTQALNKRGEPCFYNHEKLTDEEIEVFLTKDDIRFDYVKALIWCHMIPYNLHVKPGHNRNAEMKKACKELLEQEGIEIFVDDDFMTNLAILHQCDDAGSVRRDEDLIPVGHRCEIALEVLARLS